MKKIVISGVTRGLGLAMAEAFIALGHQVAGCGRTKTKIKELQNRFAAPHFFQAIDVSRDVEAKQFSEKVLEVMGTPDLLINNAAITVTIKRLWEFTAKEFDSVMDVNVKGVTNLVRHLLPAMVAQKKGVVVNFSSGWGRSVDAGVAPYCASKWAIEGLSKALALELPESMAAVALNPGIIDTDMLRQCWGEEARHYPKSAEWVKSAVPFILKIGAKDNGASLTVP
ncbi:MAG: SDR family oxidoreductase [Verrucomicrobiae bacterium]|nr:SDR family oxidoreductase [Verrucomicrobiae bacterium]